MYMDVRPACDSISAIIDVTSYYIRKNLAPWTLPANQQQGSQSSKITMIKK
jgi:hypothetical protein